MCVSIAFNAPLAGAGQRRYDDGLRGLSGYLLLALLAPDTTAPYYYTFGQNGFTCIAFFARTSIDFVLEMIATTITIY